MKEIKTKQMGEVWIASDGKHSGIGVTEEQAVDSVRFASAGVPYWGSNYVAGDAFAEKETTEEDFLL